MNSALLYLTELPALNPDLFPLSSPWTDNQICSVRQECTKSERLWKVTWLKIHRQHLQQLLVHFNEMLRDARTAYFAKIIE